MILTVDIGNSNICISLHEEDSAEPLFFDRLKTNKNRSEKQYLNDMLKILKARRVPVSSIDKTALSSVVASLTIVFAHVLSELTGKEPFIISYASRLPFESHVDVPSEVGNDLLSDITGALRKYEPPFIIFSLGTATVTIVVSEEPALKAVMIYPGVNTSLRTLSAKADALPDIDIDHPGQLMSRNTKDAMVSGIVYGTASMLDGMVDRITKETGKTYTVIATGGLAHVICPYCLHEVHIEETLLMEGLFEALKLNT